MFFVILLKSLNLTSGVGEPFVVKGAPDPSKEENISDSSVFFLFPHYLPLLSSSQLEVSKHDTCILVDQIVTVALLQSSF